MDATCRQGSACVDSCDHVREKGHPYIDARRFWLWSVGWKEWTDEMRRARDKLDVGGVYRSRAGWRYSRGVVKRQSCQFQCECVKVFSLAGRKPDFHVKTKERKWIEREIEILMRESGESGRRKNGLFPREEWKVRFQVALLAIILFFFFGGIRPLYLLNPARVVKWRKEDDWCFYLLILLLPSLNYLFSLYYDLTLDIISCKQMGILFL